MRVRTTLAATAAAAICFGSGALWLRHELYVNRFQASTVQTAAGARALADADASGTGRRPADGSARWLAIDGGDVVRATESTDRRRAAGLTGHGDLPAKVDPARLRAGLRHLGSGISQVTVRLDGRPATFVAADVPAGARTFVVADVRAGARTGVTYFVLVSPAEAEAAVDAVDPVLATGLPVAVLLVAAVAWFTAGRALKPVAALVEAVSDELAAITSAELDRRVPVPDTGDEIEALALTTNATLNRLEEAAARQRRFITDAAHELRSPLAGLRNTVEVARAGTVAADRPAALDVVLASALRLQDLTEDLLLLARLERPGTRPEHHVDLAAIAEEQVAERQYGGGGRVAFTAVVTGPAVVTGDQLQLERLVRNLLDNADRHARAAVTITVSAAGAEVVTEVVDDGAGIAAADRERAFEPFTRLDEARARDVGGSGLGLAIVQDIAARHGGRIQVDNAPGARFTLRLPAAAI